MNLEQTLVDELAFVADHAQPPIPPNVSDLVRTAQRARTRTVVTRIGGSALVAAAVVAAIVLGSQISRPGAAPTPTHPTPTPGELALGAAPRIPYVLDGRLYIDGKALPGTWSNVQTAGRTSIAFNGPEDDENNPVVLFHDGVEVARLTRAGAMDAILSPRGTKVAWIEYAGKTATLVVHDMDTGRDLGRRRVAQTGSNGGEETEGTEALGSVADDGTVTYGSVLVTHTWTPGSEPIDSTPDPQAGLAAGFPQRAGYVWLRADGVWGAWQTDRTGDPAPGGEEGAPLDGVTLQHPNDPSSRFTIALPAGSDARRLEWETSTTLLVTVFEDIDGTRWHYLRCDIGDKTCERVRMGGDG